MSAAKSITLQREAHSAPQVFLTSTQVRSRYGGISRHGPVALAARSPDGLSPTHLFWTIAVLETEEARAVGTQSSEPIDRPTKLIVASRPSPRDSKMIDANHSNLNFEQTTRFLKLLNSKAENFIFQTFHDKRPPTKHELATVVRSPAQSALLQLHALGAGIYVTVNATDGQGRKSENIIGIRAIWQEDDGGYHGEFPLAPSIVVETSPGHFHRYWFVTDDWPADEQGRADFAAVMERMVVSYGSDKRAKDISRVLRVPGFLHRKNENPHLVNLIAESNRRYSRADIIAAFPPIERQKTQTQRKQSVRSSAGRRPAHP